MFDINQIRNKNDLLEVLSAVQQRLGNVLENEAQARIELERKAGERNAIQELLRRMENLSHLKVIVDVPMGTQEEQIAQRGKSALLIRDLLTQLDEVAKGRQARPGMSEFSPELIQAIYYGHEIFMAAEGERRDLMKFLPVSQPAPTAAPIDAPIEVAEDQ